MGKVIDIVQNDTDDLDIYLKKNQAAWNIDGATAVELTMVSKADDSIKIDASGCTIQNAELGYVTFTPANDEFDTVGDYEMQTKVTIGGKRRSTKRVTATIESELGGA